MLIDQLINVEQILNNFWIVDMEIMQLETGPRLRHYLQICCGTLEPYLSEESLMDYHHYFEKLLMD